MSELQMKRRGWYVESIDIRLQGSLRNSYSKGYSYRKEQDEAHIMILIAHLNERARFIEANHNYQLWNVNEY